MPTNTEKKQPDEIAVGVESYIRDASHGILVAGLLAGDESLRTAKKTPTEWETLLDDHLSVERP